MKYLMMIATVFLLSGCIYTDSALKYAQEGTHRVDSGYKTKSEMTRYITEYLLTANQDCGVKITMMNGMPVTTVKECIRIADAMASVDSVKIVQPQNVADMMQSAGDFISKSTNMVVPVASVYYGYKTNKDNSQANVQINESNNKADSNMIGSFTSNFENSSVSSSDKDYSSTVDTSVTNISDYDSRSTSVSQ